MLSRPLPFIVMNPNPQRALGSGERLWQQWQHDGREVEISHVVEWCHNHLTGQYRVFTTRAIFEISTDAETFTAYWAVSTPTATMCCDTMRYWSTQGSKQLIKQTKLRTMMGICLRTPGFVSIAFCPWCGQRVSRVKADSIGREMIEI